MKLSRGNPSYKLCKLIEPVQKDKRWIIEYWAYSERLKTLKRKQVTIPKRYNTVSAKQSWAKAKIQQLDRLLVRGYVLDDNHTPETKPLSQLPLFRLIENHLYQIKKATIRTTTYAKYKSDVAKFKTFLEQNSLLSTLEITDTMAYQFADYLIKTGIGSDTANHTITNLRTLISEISLRGQPVGSFKFKKFKSIKVVRNVAFTPEHQNLITEWLIQNDNDLYIFTRFVYSSFVRPKELRNLNFSAIDLQNRNIFIPSSVSKNRKNEYAPINQTLFDILSCNIDSAKGRPKIFIFGKKLTFGGHGICSDNYPYNRHTVALKGCGLEGFGYTLYSWKHTGAIRAFQSGVNIKKLQNLLRHSSLQITDIYLRSLGINQDNEPLAGW